MLSYGNYALQLSKLMSYFPNQHPSPQKPWTFTVTPEVHLKLHGRWRRELVELMDVLSYLCWSRAYCSGELSKYELSLCDHLAHPCSFSLCCLFMWNPFLILVYSCVSDIFHYDELSFHPPPSLIITPPFLSHPTCLLPRPHPSYSLLLLSFG